MNVFGKLAAVVLACSVCAGASAEVIYYGNFDVTTATFLDVQESGVEVTGPTDYLYGAPTPADNSLLFNPVSFSAMSTGFGNSDTCGDTLTAIILVDEGYKIDRIEIFEAGSYSFAGTGTSATSIEAAVSCSVSILEINGLPVDESNPAYSMDRLETFLSANLVDDGIFGDLWSNDLSIWSDGLFRDPPSSILGDEEVVTKLSITINNTLSATSEAGTIAIVAKDQFQIRVFTSDTVPVPEPSTLVLIALGALSLLCFRRK